MTFLFNRRNLLTAGVLAISLAMALTVVWALHRQNEENAHRQFELLTRGVVDDIQAKLHQQEQILLGGAGLFDASEQVSRGEWRAYVERLGLHKNYPGIQGVGYSEVIPPAALAVHVAAVRAEGFPDYSVRPAGERPLYTAITYLEPFLGRNLAAFGYDMFSETTRRKAMQRAAETGQTAMTGKVRLVQETHGKEQAGFLIYVPVYARGLAAETTGTPEKRWQSLRGFVYSPLRASDLMRGILGAHDTAVDFVIHDGAGSGPESLMYASEDDHAAEGTSGPRFAARQPIDVFGSSWTVSVHSRPGFEQQFRTDYEWLILLLGCGISLALFALTRSLVNRREQALELANGMTAKIRESEERFRSMLETSPTAARIALEDGRRVIFHNARYAALINAAPGEAAGVDPASYYTDRKVYEDILARLQRGEQVLDQLVELAIPGAGTKWALASYYPFRHEGQAAVLGWFHDITAQRQAEDRTRQSRKLLADVLDAASEFSIIATDPTGLITMFSRGSERMLGYSAEEMVGRQSPAILHLPEEVIARADELTKSLGKPVAGFHTFIELPKQQGVEKREWTYVRKDGSQLPVSLVVTAMRGEAGEIVGYLGIAEDITERRLAKVALQEQVQRTQAILDNAIDGIITIDGQGTISSFNKAAERIFGYAADAVINRNVRMLMPEPHRSAHDGYLHNYQTSGVARIIGIGREVEGQRADGSLFPMDLSISEVRHEGQRMYVGLVRDITERKRIEQMKSEFVSTVSHELRTPLTSISGALGLLAGGAIGAMPEQARPLLEIAHKNSLRLNRLINDLLDMEKIAAGKMQFDLQVQPVLPLLEQAIESTAGYGEQYGVSLQLLGTAEDALVRVDAQRLIQVLANFISNAAKFSPAGATVEISATRVAGSLRILVTDHGPGITEEFRSRIFQKFSQADASDTRQKGGTGLGLAISKEMIEHMGGQVGFESTPGSGATFHCDLPIVAAAVPNPADPAEPAAGDAAPRILIVEDDPDVARLLEIMLSRAGYRTDVAHDGRRALELLAENTYAAMTLDLKLPDINGLEVVRRVREEPSSANLPIVVVSAGIENGELALNSEFPGVDWLAKPIDEDRMLATIEQSLPQDMKTRPRVLHVEDDVDLHQVIRAMTQTHFDLDHAATLKLAHDMLNRHNYEIVILDLTLTDGSGWDLLPRLRELRPAPRVIVLSGAELSADESAMVEGTLLKSRVSAQALLDALGASIARTSRSIQEIP